MSAKSFALLLMKVLTKKGVFEINGANIYFGSGDETITIDKDGIIADLNKKKKTFKKKKPKNDSWPLRPMKTNAVLPEDDGTCPWD